MHKLSTDRGDAVAGRSGRDPLTDTLWIDEAARRAGVGRTTVYKAIAAGELKSLKIGRRRLIRAAALDAWLASKELPR
jgi:excisionase family DNA binding protein